MTRILRTVLDICLLRAGPQDLPASPALFGPALLAYVATSWLLSATELGRTNALWLVATDVVLLVVLVHFVLRVRNFPKRQHQTLIALLTCGALFGLIGWPLLQWRSVVADETQALLLPTSLLMALTLWNLTVTGHILRHALSTSLFNGIVLSVIYMLISLTIYETVFTPPI
jgi:Na+/melibiose symporter-like transporter